MKFDQYHTPTDGTLGLSLPFGEVAPGVGGEVGEVGPLLFDAPGNFFFFNFRVGT